jgi:hypothetical protein
MEKITPSLIENSTKFYLRTALKESKNIKNKYITICVNIFLFILFIIFIVGFLLYKYKGKLTPQEKEKKDREKQEYLINMMQRYSVEKQKESQSLITNLPLNHPQIF